MSIRKAPKKNLTQSLRHKKKRKKTLISSLRDIKVIQKSTPYANIPVWNTKIRTTATATKNNSHVKDSIST